MLSDSRYIIMINEKTATFKFNIDSIQVILSNFFIEKHDFETILKNRLKTLGILIKNFICRKQTF